MKVVLTCVALVAALAMAMAAVDEHSGWVEPSYASADAINAVESASFLEDGTRVGAGAKGKVRGISHTVAGRHGMVTYISPARHIQTSGIVLTPPPTVAVQQIAVPQPLYVQPVVMPHADYHYAVGAHDIDLPHDHHLSGHHHHLPHLSDDDYSVQHVIGHENGASEHELAHALHDRHSHGHAHVHVHGHHHHHHHHRLAAGRVHIGSGVHAGNVHVHPYAPLAVPASLMSSPYHVAHYGHDSPVSQGPILVPHGPEGGIALEEADYAGYNPGPAIQFHSVPTAYYSDGTAHRASITQQYN